MNAAKRMRLEQAGWKVGDAREFLGLSDREVAIVKAKLQRQSLRKSRHVGANATPRKRSGK
jgi:hypothetical protein